jgi:hypothetical protein
MRALEPLVRFVLDILLGVIGFIVVGLGAWAIGLFVHWLKAQDTVPSIFIYIMSMIEYLLFGIAVVGFVYLVLMALYKFVREVWRIST